MPGGLAELAWVAPPAVSGPAAVAVNPELSEVLAKLSCAEPLATETPAVVAAAKPGLPGLLAELPRVEPLVSRMFAVAPETLTELPCEPLGATMPAAEPETLAEFPCVEPLGAILPAAVALEAPIPAVEPEMLIELSNVSPEDDNDVAPGNKPWLDGAVVRERKVVGDAATADTDV